MTKASLATWLELLSHSGFVILSTFVIRISSLSRASSRRLLQTYERPSLRDSNAAEEPRLHRPPSAVRPSGPGPVPAVLLQETAPPSAVLLRRTGRGGAHARVWSDDFPLSQARKVESLFRHATARRPGRSA